MALGMLSPFSFFASITVLLGKVTEVIFHFLILSEVGAQAKLALHHPIGNQAPFQDLQGYHSFRLPGEKKDGLSFPIQTYDLCNSINYYDST